MTGLIATHFSIQRGNNSDENPSAKKSIFSEDKLLHHKLLSPILSFAINGDETNRQIFTVCKRFQEMRPLVVRENSKLAAECIVRQTLVIERLEAVDSSLQEISSTQARRLEARKAVLKQAIEAAGNFTSLNLFRAFFLKVASRPTENEIVTNETASLLAPHFRNVTELNASMSALDSKGLEAFGVLKLKKLDISTCINLCQDAFKILAKFSELRELNIFVLDPKIDRNQLFFDLRPILPNLTALSFSWGNLDARGLGHLYTARSLQHLTVDRFQGYSNNGLRLDNERVFEDLNLPILHGLVSLDIELPKDSSSVPRYLAICAKLTNLIIWYKPEKFSLSGLTPILPQLQSLQLKEDDYLSINYDKMPAGDFSILTNCKSLTALDVQKTGISDNDIAKIARFLAGLKELTLPRGKNSFYYPPRVTDKSYELLASLRAKPAAKGIDEDFAELSIETLRG